MSEINNFKYVPDVIKQKRRDIQCWRGYSILAVLLFHLWPNSFPNGFVGVDIFFVISGFLMSKLYFQNQNFSFNDVTQFYYRRIKRIVPIYLIVVIITLISLYNTLLPMDINSALEDSKWAIFFVTNIQDYLAKIEYFDEISKSRFFRHCWSLAVEMQFYTIFPIIAFSRIKLYSNLYKSILTLTFILSFVYQNTRENHTEFYEFLFSRLWQFIVGIAAAGSVQNQAKNKGIIYIALISVSITMFFPIKLPIIWLNIGVIITGISIASSSSSSTTPFIISCGSGGAVYLEKIGEISYIIYLIHWPLITYMRYSSIKNDLGLFDGCIIGFSSIMLSKIFHKFIEIPLLSFCGSVKRLLIILMILYCSFFGILRFHSHFKTKNERPSNLTMNFINSISNFEEKLNFNPSNWTTQNDMEFVEYAILHKPLLELGIRCKNLEKHKNLEKFKKLRYCEINSNNFNNGNLTAVVIGNSFVSHILPLLTVNPLFKKIILISEVKCAFPEIIGSNCGAVTEIVYSEIPKIKPDIIFIYQAYTQKLRSPLKSEIDSEFSRLNETYQFLQEHSSVIISTKEQFNYPISILSEFLRRKFYGYQIDFSVPNELQFSELKQLLKTMHCPKCLWIDYQNIFCNQNFCDPIDSETKLPLLHDDFHLNFFGIYRSRKTVNNIIEMALKRIK